MIGVYEIHVKVDPPRDETKRETFERLADDTGWQTSEIARDPLLGPATRFYFTTHTRTYAAARIRLEGLCGSLRAHDVEVLREKIECIVYDTKTGIGVA